MKLAFFDTKPYDKPGFDEHIAGTDIEIKYFETRLGEDTVQLAKGFDGVCVFVNDTVNAKVVNELYDLGVRVVALRCAGFNNVDTRACFGKIHVFRVPAYSPYAVAEHAMALLLTINRKIHKAYNRTREFNFSLAGLTGFDLHGKTVGVIGTGKIGRIFADICKGFGMNVLAYDKFPNPDAGLHYVDLPELFAKADVISLHCPLTEETHHMIDDAAVEQMKKGVVIVNTSRGGLIDTESLINGIKVGIVGEIFVKFSALGNNQLEKFLISEGAEPVMGGLVDFFLYSITDSIMDYKLYGLRFFKSRIYKIAYRFFLHKQDDLIRAIRENDLFTPPTSFRHTATMTAGYMGMGMKMGEGWLLTAEMLELIDEGVRNIVCAQPFGCLPNHIVGKGMMKPIKERHPEVNLVAIDYDAGATQINQENRIKLMLANAKRTGTGGEAVHG